MNVQLAAKVKAANDTNAYAMKFHDEVKAALLPFVGQKVLKVDGCLTAKVQAALPDLPNTPTLRVLRNNLSSLSLSWTVKGTEHYPNHRDPTMHHPASQKTYVYIGDLRDGVLTRLSPDQKSWRTDFTVEEIEKAREEYVKAEKAARDARSRLYDFGEYDV